MKLQKTLINKEGYFIREIQLSDADHYRELLNHNAVKPFIPNQLLPKSLFDMIRIITALKGLSSANKGAYWALCHPDGHLIGALGYESWNPSHLRLEVAFELHPDHQGKGLMTQAMEKIIDFGFNDIGAIRIEAFTLLHNSASIRLLERLNFNKEAQLKKYRMFNGTIHDIYLFALTK